MPKTVSSKNPKHEKETSENLWKRKNTEIKIVNSILEIRANEDSKEKWFCQLFQKRKV